MAIIIKGAHYSDVNISSPNYLSLAVDFSSATWNTAAEHEIFTVTGLVRIHLWAECTLTLTDAADAARIQLGYEGDTDYFIAITEGATGGAELIQTGALWYDSTPTLIPEAPATAIFDSVMVPSGLDIGYEVTGAAFLTGGITFHCVWEALNSTGSVTAGAGGVL